MTIDILKQAIISLFNFSVFEENDEKTIFTAINHKKVVLNKKKAQSVISELSTLSSEQDIELFNTYSYEVLIRKESRFSLFRKIEQNDDVNKIEYKIDKPTDTYLFFFLFNLNNQNTPIILNSRIMQSRFLRIFDKLTDSQISEEELDVFNVIKEIVPGLETLQVKSETIKKRIEFEALVYAFLFNIGYNTDKTILPLRFIDEFTQPYKMGRLRRADLDEVEPPKRIYINELILHYQKGMSTESIEHQFLSFYHVLEHFFEKIYNDDILISIKAELTKPNFSYKRNKDILALIGLVQNRLKYKNDEFLVNEPEALELTLKKFIDDTDFLKSELEDISPALINYFKTTEVPFSNGNKVNFESGTRDEILKNLSKRIYSTRNAIVHSKETDKSKYTPFKDDKHLFQEIYLMRLISEIVIISNSKEL